MNKAAQRKRRAATVGARPARMAEVEEGTERRAGRRDALVEVTLALNERLWATSLPEEMGGWNRALDVVRALAERQQ